MEKSKKTIIIVIVAVLALLFICALLVWSGYAFYRYRTRANQEVLPSDSKVDVCLYDGQSYEGGESFEATDGCNECYCDSDSGEVSCTEKYCDEIFGDNDNPT